MKKFILFLLMGAFIHFFPSRVEAYEQERYVTVVNPVRSRDKWVSFDSVRNQFELLMDLNIPATYLLQYGILSDEQAFSFFKALPSSYEKGIFLEVDENLAADSFVGYKLGEGDWARADKVLLSGYNPQERLRMIDVVFARFKQVFGKYPVSVGAWYIDTVSLNYLKEKYNVTAVLEVADQYQTDTYGVWGKPWGTPYYPSKINTLIPAQNEADLLDLVKIQWALRDPVKGYGLTVFDSTFSMQANDYLSHNLNISYFEKLTDEYLNSPNPFMQITVGLEAGQEGAGFMDEYIKQIQFLKKKEREGKLKFIDMDGFANRFRNYYPAGNPNYVISGSDTDEAGIKALWYSTPFYRAGLIQKDHKVILRDLRINSLPYLYKDIIVKDEKKQLIRVIPALISQAEGGGDMTLVDNASILLANHEGNVLQLEIAGNDNRKYLMEFNSQRILFDGKEWFNVNDFNTGYDAMIKSISRKLTDSQVNRKHNWTNRVCFSKLDGISYIGITLSPNKFLGFKSIFPFLTLKEFPYPVISHFKTLPDVSPVLIMSNYFINYLNNSTIRVISQKRI